MSPSTQAMEALALANEIRLSRAAFKCKVAKVPAIEGCLLVRELVLNPPAWGEGMPIRDLILSIRRFGEARLMWVLNQADIRNSGRRVSELTERQRDAIAQALMSYATTPPSQRRLSERSAHRQRWEAA